VGIKRIKVKSIPLPDQKHEHQLPEVRSSLTTKTITTYTESVGILKPYGRVMDIEVPGWRHHRLIARARSRYRLAMRILLPQQTFEGRWAGRCCRSERVR